MKNLWSNDLFLKSFFFAAKAHNGQMVPGSNLPYIIHISCVCSELMSVTDKKYNCNLLLQCGALHDTLEDTKTSYKQLYLVFGKSVADGVQALSKNEDIDKLHQLDDSISRIIKQPKEIWMVKMADRIINLNPPPSFWSSEKIENYYKKSFLVYDAFKNSNEQLSLRLLKKIKEYKKYI